MTQTIASLRTELMGELGLSETNSNVGTSSDSVLSYMNEAHEKFINNRNWTFNNAFFSLITPVMEKLGTDLETSDVSLSLDSTAGYGSEGKINIDNDIISFTANDTVTNILTITAAEIDRKHLAGEEIDLLYPMPSDFGKPTEVKIDKLSYVVDDVRNDFKIKHRNFWQHHFVDDAGNYKVYLQFPHTANAKTVYIKYARLPVDLTAQDATTYYLNVPNPFYADYIKNEVISRIYRHLEEVSMAQEYERLANMKFRKATAYDSKQHAGTKHPLRTRWDNPQSILYGKSLTGRR